MFKLPAGLCILFNSPNGVLVGESRGKLQHAFDNMTNYGHLELGVENPARFSHTRLAKPDAHKRFNLASIETNGR